MASFSDVVSGLKDQYAEKGAKFLAVSAFNVVFGLVLLAVANAGFGWSFVPSNVFAVGISAGPAYVLSRYWVWQKTGKSHFWKEVVPFWSLGFLGLILSTILVAMAENYSDMTLVLMGANLLAFGCVWVAKFFILDRVLFRQYPIVTKSPAVAVPARRAGLRARSDDSV